MQLKLITVRYDRATGGFPADPLAELEGEIVSVVEHFFQQGGLPHLLLIVHYRPYQPVREVLPARGMVPPPGRARSPRRAV